MSTDKKTDRFYKIESDPIANSKDCVCRYVPATPADLEAAGYVKREELRKLLKDGLNEAWDKMGSTGSYTYFDDCTTEESMWFGRFFVYEMLWNELFKNENWTIADQK